MTTWDATSANGAGLIALLLLTLAAGTSCSAEQKQTSPLSLRTADDPRSLIISASLPANVAAALPEGPVPAETAGPILHFARLESDGREGPPLFGEYERKGTSLRFTPEFRLAAGARYRATLTLPNQPPASTEYIVPAAAIEAPARVERIYPSADHLPANLLKFYIHFSRPMRQTDAIFDQIHIIDTNLDPVSDPWRRFPQWSDDGKRLTLWIHPGRVKRGVNLREEIGPVLVPERQYRLVVDRAVEDVEGRPLGESFTKSFTAMPEDHARISLRDWKVEAPHAKTREPLKIVFPKALDAALLLRFISVQVGSGQTCRGGIAVGANETTWTFCPEAPWVAGMDYSIRVDELMEDLAGNTPVRVFDSEIGKDEQGVGETRLVFRAK